MTLKSNQGLKEAIKAEVRQQIRAKEQDTITVYRVWDRQTPRHKWQLVVEEPNEQRARMIADRHQARIAKAQGWELGQVGFEVATIQGGPKVMSRGDFATSHRPSIRILESHRAAESIGGEAGQLKGELNRLNTKLIAYMGRVDRHFQPPRQIPYVQAMKTAVDHVHQAFMILKDIEAEIDKAERGF